MHRFPQLCGHSRQLSDAIPEFLDPGMMAIFEKPATSVTESLKKEGRREREKEAYAVVQVRHASPICLMLGLPKSMMNWHSSLVMRPCTRKMGGETAKVSTVTLRSERGTTSAVRWRRRGVCVCAAVDKTSLPPKLTLRSWSKHEQFSLHHHVCHSSIHQPHSPTIDSPTTFILEGEKSRHGQSSCHHPLTAR